MNFTKRMVGKVLKGLTKLVVSPVLAMFLIMAGFSAADAQTVEGSKPTAKVFSGPVSVLTSNVTTNVTCNGAPLYRGQGVTLLASFGSTTAEAAALKVSVECSTNQPFSTTTNWHRPFPPVVAVFTNNAAVGMARGAYVIPASTLENMAQVRPFTLQNVSVANGFTNVSVAASAIPVAP